MSAKAGSCLYEGTAVLATLPAAEIVIPIQGRMEWGNKRLFYPVETAEHVFKDDASSATTTTPATSGSGKTHRKSGAATQSGGDRGAKSGYVSCGG